MERKMITKEGSEKL
jgi:hypothetical protein